MGSGWDGFSFLGNSLSTNLYFLMSFISGISTTFLTWKWGRGGVCGDDAWKQ